MKVARTRRGDPSLELRRSSVRVVWPVANAEVVEDGFGDGFEELFAVPIATSGHC